MCNVFTVAFEICKNSGWNTSNLALQKLLYISQVFSLGQRDKILFKDKIEAWDYGPVIPKVYHKFKLFYKSPIPQSVFPWMPVSLISAEEKQFIQYMSDLTNGFKPWELVLINIILLGKKHTFLILKGYKYQ